MQTRILIADDSRPVRRSLRSLLEQKPDWKVCAEAVDGADAVAKAQQFKPDIIVLDLFMPRMTGLDAARAIGKLLPPVPILMFTLYITAYLVEQAKNAGINGVVQKSDTQQVIRGIEAVLGQQTFFNETVQEAA